MQEQFGLLHHRKHFAVWDFSREDNVLFKLKCADDFPQLFFFRTVPTEDGPDVRMTFLKGRDDCNKNIVSLKRDQRSYAQHVDGAVTPRARRKSGSVDTEGYYSGRTFPMVA